MRAREEQKAGLSGVADGSAAVLRLWERGQKSASASPQGAGISSLITLPSAAYTVTRMGSKKAPQVGEAGSDA